MKLRYTGKDFNVNVNGRPMRKGDELTDPQEVKDCKDMAEFETISAAPAKAPKPKADKKESK